MLNNRRGVERGTSDKTDTSSAEEQLVSPPPRPRRNLRLNIPPSPSQNFEEIRGPAEPQLTRRKPSSLCTKVREFRPYIQSGIFLVGFLLIAVWILEKFHILHYLGIMSMAPVVIQASSKQTATIIFLHGLGDTGHGWASSLAQIKPPYAKLICPTAPAIPVTLNMGMRMPSWFDLKSLDPNASEDEDGIKKSADNIRKLIHDEIKAGIPANRIVLGGFSMGGALALYTGLTETTSVGGIVALSSWLPLHRSFPWNSNARPPVLQCHGEADPLVLYSFGVMTSAILKSQLPKYTFKSYPQLQHSSSEQEMEDVKSFMKEILPPA